MSAIYTDISYDLIQGIFAKLSPSLNGQMVFQEVREMTIAGSAGGWGSITNNGIDRAIVFDTTATKTVTNFVTTNAAAYLAAGTILTGSGDKLTFKAKTPGIGFVGVTVLNKMAGTLTGTVVVADIIKPVYKSLPKPAANDYVLIDDVQQSEDGTKDNFIYEGTVRIRVVTDNLTRADKTTAYQMLNAARKLLKPTRSGIFSIGSVHTLVVFSPESSTEMIEQSETIVKISIIDMYNFIIQ